MDLGELKGPVLIFGGPYSNLAATRAVRDVAESLGIPASNTICTGDTVAYCAEPDQTVATLRDWGCHVVMGNCEESLALQASDCGCGFDTGSTCSVLSVDWYRFANDALSSTHRDWMGQLPRRIRLSCAGMRFLVIHGSIDRINEFIFESDPVAIKQRQLAGADADAVVGGHCGLPFGQSLENGYWMNAGVIGMPANDGTPDGWYLLLTPVDNGVRVSWHRLRYGYQSSYDAMVEAGVSLPYAECLKTGLWPSQDVLPGAERRLRGRALAPRILS